jgi:hypothetical protein
MLKYPEVDMTYRKSQFLVIHCSDPRFQAAYREVIDSLGEHYDPIVGAGASKKIVENETILPEIQMLHSLHNFDKAYILDHMKCAAFNIAQEKEEKAAHFKTMKAAKEILECAMPGLSVEYHLLGPKAEIFEVES